ncbi:MAG TPA: hypothetical protein VFV80_06720 [Geminicoccaceae bacterium]|nr:hypothetical protein [Geminicoccaceae bacterium]
MSRRSILLACAAAAVLPLRPAAAGMLGDVPDAIVCDIEKGKLVVYAARRLEDGSTLYEALEREFMAVITIDPQGVLHWANRPGCDGKSVGQLREEGKAFDFSG